MQDQFLPDKNLKICGRKSCINETFHINILLHVC